VKSFGLVSCWGCSWREWIEGGSECVNIFSADSSGLSMKDMVHTIRAVSSLN